MDLAVGRPSLAGRIGGCAEIRPCQWGKKGSVPNLPQLRPSSTSGGVNLPLQLRRRGIGFRFDLASGLLSCNGRGSHHGKGPA
jgi:hypothetical protein